MPVPPQVLSNLKLPTTLTAAQVVERLNAVPGFIVVNAQGQALTVQTPGGPNKPMVGVFLRQAGAQGFLESLQKRDPTLGATLSIKVVGLGELYQKSLKPEEGMNLAFIPDNGALADARTVLQQLGKPADGFRGTPLFLVELPGKGLLTLRQSDKTVLPAFFTLADAQGLAANYNKTRPEGAPEARIALSNLEFVIDAWRKVPDPAFLQLQFALSKAVVDEAKAAAGEDVVASLTEETALFLLSDEGAALLNRGKTALTNARGLDPERRAGALAVLEGRERALRRGWEQAESLFLTADALAQASSEGIAHFHAQQLVGCERVLDACCGLGRDTLALARAGCHVTAVDTDPARICFARANAERLGVAERITFVCADATTLDGRWDGAFFDPARREGAARFSADAERYLPSLDFLETLRARCGVVVAKLSPALADETLTQWGGSLTFLSEERTCKEACLVLGAEETPEPRALLLPTGASYSADEPPRVANTPAAFLLDPDPAILRAGALGTLAERTGAALLSPDDAYLTAEAASDDPGVRCYRIRTALPYRDRTLGRWLREQGIGRLVVKKRRFPKEPAAVQKELGLKGKGDEATLVIVAQGKSWLGIVCDPV